MTDGYAVLPHDSYGRDKGLFIASNLPYVLGSNIAGVIEQLGPEVTSFAVGDLVLGQGNPVASLPDFAGLQQFALLNTEAMCRVPDGYSIDDAVTFPTNFTTSYVAMFHPKFFGLQNPSMSPRDRKLPPQTLVIIGGGSNCGRYGIQFAKMAGVERIITIASTANEAALKKLGATHVIDRHRLAAEIKEEVQRIVEGDGATHVYDCISFDYSMPFSLLSSTKKSTFVPLHTIDEELRMRLAQGRDVTVPHMFAIYHAVQPLASEIWTTLAAMMESRTIEPARYKIVEGFNLEAIERGLDSYRNMDTTDPFVVHLPTSWVISSFKKVT